MTSVDTVLESVVVASAMLFLTILGSLVVANVVGGGQHLPFGLKSDRLPMSGPSAWIGVLIFGALTIVPQLALIAVAVGPNRMFGQIGSVVLMLELPLAILWGWYLTKRYERDRGRTN